MEEDNGYERKEKQRKHLKIKKCVCEREKERQRERLREIICKKEKALK